MNLSFIDWLIVLIVLIGMIYSVSFTKGLMRSVTDFLSAGRYLISVSQGAAGLGAISIVYKHNLFIYYNYMVYHRRIH